MNKWFVLGLVAAVVAGVWAGVGRDAMVGAVWKGACVLTWHCWIYAV
jgi:hypothetical protein